MIPPNPEASGPVRGTGCFLHDMGYPDPEGARTRFLLENDLGVAVEDGRLTPNEAARILAAAPAREP
ncbi:hypothetical protein MKK88_04675 [Methylobacterium sp. E-005]|uniref:hypothetical protein n=1 Tax=Methylobacterium sp. E-005 TaxID=2836549 RepID=UPI001FB96350|nr:hypothetical protein [Methylobacterium sp. E-005]MCJ2085291.1 hypothetical protein [Methylobacterium sp. E-005]